MAPKNNLENDMWHICTAWLVLISPNDRRLMLEHAPSCQTETVGREERKEKKKGRNVSSWVHGSRWMLLIHLCTLPSYQRLSQPRNQRRPFVGNRFCSPFESSETAWAWVTMLAATLQVHLQVILNFAFKQVAIPSLIFCVLPSRLAINGLDLFLFGIFKFWFTFHTRYLTEIPRGGTGRGGGGGCSPPGWQHE